MALRWAPAGTSERASGRSPGPQLQQVASVLADEEPTARAQTGSALPCCSPVAGAPLGGRGLKGTDTCQARPSWLPDQALPPRVGPLPGQLEVKAQAPAWAGRFPECWVFPPSSPLPWACPPTHSAHSTAPQSTWLAVRCMPCPQLPACSPSLVCGPGVLRPPVIFPWPSPNPRPAFSRAGPDAEARGPAQKDKTPEEGLSQVLRTVQRSRALGSEQLVLEGCQTRAGQHSLSGPWFPHLENGTNSPHSGRLWLGPGLHRHLLQSPRFPSTCLFPHEPPYQLPLWSVTPVDRHP